MAKIIKSMDEMAKECGYFYSADVDIDVNNGYNCAHQNQEEYEIVDGKKIGKCYCWSCPLAYEVDQEDFKDPEIDKNGWNIDDYEEASFLVVEAE